MVTILEMVKRDKESSNELLNKWKEDWKEDLEHLMVDFMDEILKLVKQ